MNKLSWIKYKCVKCGYIRQPTDYQGGMCPKCGGDMICKMPSYFSETVKPKDWYIKEDTPEATEEHTKQCFKSLEQQGKLKMPDRTKGDKKIGENKDWQEFADRM